MQIHTRTHKHMRVQTREHKPMSRHLLIHTRTNILTLTLARTSTHYSHSDTSALTDPRRHAESMLSQSQVLYSHALTHTHVRAYTQIAHTPAKSHMRWHTHAQALLLARTHSRMRVRLHVCTLAGTQDSRGLTNTVLSHTCTRAILCIHTKLHISPYNRTDIYAHMHTLTLSRTCTCTYSRTYIRTVSRTHTCAFASKHICSSTHNYIHARTIKRALRCACTHTCTFAYATRTYASSLFYALRLSNLSRIVLTELLCYSDCAHFSAKSCVTASPQF